MAIAKKLNIAVASMHRLGDASKTLVITRVPLSDSVVGTFTL